MIAARGVAELIALGINALVIIAVTRAVGPAAFGQFAVAATVGQILLIATNAGLHTLGAQRIANLNSEGDAGEHALTPIWCSVVSLRLLLGTALAIATAAAVTVLVSDDMLRGFLYAVLIALPFVALKSEWLLVARGEAQLVAVTRALGAVVTAGAVLTLINDAADARFLPLIFVVPIATTGMAGLAIVLFGRRIDTHRLVLPTRKEAVAYLATARHYFVAEISVFVYGSSDRLFLFVLAGPTIVGLYDAAYRLLQPFAAISSVVGDSMYRSLATALGTERLRVVFSRWVDLMSVATVPVGFITLAFGPWIVGVVYGAAFSGASSYLALLGFTVTFGYMAAIVSIPFTAWNAPRAYSRAVLAGGVANLAMNFLLIPAFAGIGAAIATIGAKVTVGLWGLPTFRRLTDYPIARHLAFYVAASVISVVIGAGIGSLVGLRELGQLVLCALAYVALVAVRLRRDLPRPVPVPSV
jgi:O-antigen/teichoic acid export membrane protein